MGKKVNYEHLSEHDKYYLAQKSRKEDLGFAIFWGLMISGILWFIVVELGNGDWVPWLYHLYSINIEIGAGTIIVSCVGISIIRSSKRVQKAKEALAGDLVSPRTPRFAQGFILTKVHREDVEIGKQIHSDFSEDLVSGDVFFMFRAECTSVGSHTVNWSMPRENYGRDGSPDYGGGYGGYEDREYHGSTTHYSAELKLKSTSIVFSASEYESWIKKGDIVDLLVEVMRHRGKDGESCAVKKLKSLTPLTK